MTQSKLRGESRVDILICIAVILALLTPLALARFVKAAADAPRTITVGAHGWQVQSSDLAREPGEQISRPGFSTASWLKVTPDDAGAPGTEINALVQNGRCPDVFFSDNMRRCFGYMPARGPVTAAQFAAPWWFRAELAVPLRAGQHVRLSVPGVVGEGELWVNGERVADRDVVSGAFAGHSFDVTRLVHDGNNAVAVKMFANNPLTMFTIDNVDWTQIPPDNQTGIQYPIELTISDALSGGNAHVNQRTAADLSSSALTIKLDVRNDSDRAQRGEVRAQVIAPDGAPIEVSQSVSIAAHTTQAVAFTPDRFPRLTIAHPRVWWPYLLGDQPLYTLRTEVVADDRVSTISESHFGIRTVTTHLVGRSPEAPDGARRFAINGTELVFRGGGYAPDLLLRYAKADVAHQIALIKNLGLTGIRIEGHDMPADFYDQMDRAGIPVLAGFTCCNAWELPLDGAGVTERDYRIIHDSARSIAERERNHPSVITYGWSDNSPIPRQEQEVLRAFADADFEVPILASAEYKSTPTLGPSGEKEGPYDWVPPSYWYDTSHVDANDDTRTNAGGSWGFDSEQSAGDTVPTLDSLRRFLSADDQAKLWQDPSFNQYHANFEPTHGGYAFGTLFVFDAALGHRYGAWRDLTSYVSEAQIANYENTRAQFEAFIDHSTDPTHPATGTIYWQLNKGWPTLLWSLYNFDGDQPGSFFGAKKANRPLHALFTYDDHTVTLDNFGGRGEAELSVQAVVYDLDGRVLDRQSRGGLALASQEVKNRVLALRVPATTAPPAAASVYFVELVLRQRDRVVDRNVYWLSTQADLVDWPATLGVPQATMTQYGDLTALQKLAPSTVRVTATTAAAAGPDGADTITTVTVTNTSKALAFFLRADVRRGTAGGAELAGDNQVRAATWDDNDISLWPGESQVITAAYRARDLGGAAPVVSVSGWNTGRLVITAPR